MANAEDEAWAWAAVRFGWTPGQWAALTHAQRALLMRAQEDRAVEVTTLVRDAVANAVANVMRKKGRKAVPLFRKTKKRAARGGARPAGGSLARLIEGIEKAERGRK